MAETTDRPQVPSDAIVPGDALHSSPPASAETYQALSLMAMAGFGLAVVYALVVLVGALFSLLGHKPWLMPYWTFLLPIAVLIVCKVARTRIVNSEGTLGGLVFTTWGSRLAIVICIPYIAYYFATFLAVRAPAIDCANDFFQKIKDDHLAQLFLMSKDEPTKGKSAKAMREEVESRFNQSQPGGPGMPATSGDFTRFRQERFVRFVQMDGDQASCVPTGVALWEYTKSGYRVVLTYHLATSLADFDMKVEAFGRDPKGGEGKSRQWQVRLVRSETGVIPESIKLTPRGKEFEQRTLKAKEFVEALVAKINDGDALPPKERESYSKLIRGLDTFWAAGPKLHDNIAERIRNTFRPGSGGKKIPINLSLLTAGIPLLRESDGRTTAWIDTSIRYYEESGFLPQYVVDARLVISAENNAAANSSSAWRFDGLEIDSGRTAPEMRRMMQNMPGRGGPGGEEAGPEGPQRIRPPEGAPPPPPPGAPNSPPP